MTDQTVNETVARMKGYLGLKYGTYQNFENDLIARIQAQNLTASQQAAVLDYVQTQEPHSQFFAPNITDNTKEFLLDTYLSGTGEYLQWYGAQGLTFKGL